jgi:hypothetical protein
MKRTRRTIDVLRCKDGVAVPIKQPRVVSAIRERDMLIARLREQLSEVQRVVGVEVAKRHVLLGSRWMRVGIALRLLRP